MCVCVCVCVCVCAHANACTCVHFLSLNRKLTPQILTTVELFDFQLISMHSTRQQKDWVATIRYVKKME